MQTVATIMWKLWCRKTAANTLRAIFPSLEPKDVAEIVIRWTWIIFCWAQNRMCFQLIRINHTFLISLMRFGSVASISLFTCWLIALCFCYCLEVIFDVVWGTNCVALVTSLGQFGMHFLHFALPNSYNSESLIVHPCFTWVFCLSYSFEFASLKFLIVTQCTLS